MYYFVIHNQRVCAFIISLMHRIGSAGAQAVGIMNDLFIAPLVVMAKSAPEE